MARIVFHFQIALFLFGKESHSSAYSLRFGLRILSWNQSFIGSLAPSSIDSAGQPTPATMSPGTAVWEITQIIAIAGLELVLFDVRRFFPSMNVVAVTFSNGVCFGNTTPISGLAKAHPIGCRVRASQDTVHEHCSLSRPDAK